MSTTIQPKLQLRDYQENGIALVDEAIQQGHKAICLVATTGAGKTLWASEYISRAVARGQHAMILTNRRILLSQAGAALERHGVHHGVYAAGFEFEPREDVQLGSIQTIACRDSRPPCDLVLVDEAHSNTGNGARSIIDYYKQHGATIIGLTATPVGLAGIYDCLVEMVKGSELIKRGMLVPGRVYGPSEPDLRGVRITSTGEYAHGQAAQRVMECLVFGDVFDHWKRLNDGRLSVVFAPGVQESKWFVEQFEQRGVSSAHIDGSLSQAERDDIFSEMSNGKVQLVSSCGVLREGWDFPAVSHGLLVQACYGLSTFLQIVGRLKRAFPSKSSYILQDHAGAFWRHGNPDADRNWVLGDSDLEIAKRRAEECRAGAQQDIRCQQCGMVRQHGIACPGCGHRQLQSIRLVRTVAGELVEMHGDAISTKRPKSTWEMCHTTTCQ
jgi:DNA repair protein RadD